MKRLLQFLFGGLIYFLAELIFRAVVHHRPPHLIMFLLGGLSLVFILFIEDTLKINLIIKSLIGGSFITLLELVVGSYFKFIENDPMWVYSGITFLGIISLKWSLLWCALTLVTLLIYKVIKRYKNK